MSDLLLSRGIDRRLALIVASATLWILAGAQAAHAAFPGANGKISFDRYTNGITGFAAYRAKPVGRAPNSRGLSGQIDQIWTTNPDGSGAANVSNSSRLDEYANWSADGTKLVFDDWAGENDQIWSMNGDGSAQTNLIGNTDQYTSWAAWSPDGTRVAYVQYNTVTSNDEIWVMNADGSNQHLLVPPTPTTSDGNPNWSPDGTKIAFTRYDTEADLGQVYVANADGSGVAVNLSNNSDDDEDPNWSPDGTKIAFDKSIVNQSNYQIWVMNADGSSPHVVVASNDSQDEAAAWSPDGTQIAYQKQERARKLPVPSQQIWVVNADGSNDHQVTTPDSGYGDYVPDWQPVGSPASSASLSGCTATAGAVVHAADPTGFISPLSLHYKVDGGPEQVVAADGAGNVTVALSNGAHTVEYWAADGAGYQEAQHHTGSLTVDTVNQCLTPAKTSVAGVRRACVSKTFRVRVRVSTSAKPKSVRVFLGKKRVLTTTKTSFTLKINPKKLRRRTQLKIVTTDALGRVTTTKRTIARCAVKKPRRKSAPRFTG